MVCLGVDVLLGQLQQLFDLGLVVERVADRLLEPPMGEIQGRVEVAHIDPGPSVPFGGELGQQCSAEMDAGPGQRVGQLVVDQVADQGILELAPLGGGGVLMEPWRNAVP